MSAKFRTGYMDTALYNLADVIEQCREDLADVNFDTLVGTGFSGGIVIPSLALALDKKFVLIRKESDDSHHGPGRLIGELGERWIFVDDFVSSGRTRDRVMEKIKAGAIVEDQSTEYVGDYMYANTDTPWRTAADAWPGSGYSDPMPDYTTPTNEYF